jgi:hypothetical protein
MRSGELDLEGVAAQFAAWRANKQGRLIPAALWRSAIRLLDRHSGTAICRRLRLCPARFKQAREGAIAGVGRLQPRQEADRRRAPRPQRVATMAMVPAGGAFVELPAVGMTVGDVVGARGDEAPPVPAGGCRLVLESARGILSLVTRAPDGDLTEAVCRFVLGGMGSGSRR